MEIVIVLGLLALVMAGAAQLNLAAGQNVSSAGRQIKANILAAETLEALRIVKEKNWDDLYGLTRDTDYYLAYDDANGHWSVEEEKPDDIDGLFARSFVVKEARRDAVTGRIVSSGGEADVKTLLVEAEVGWNERDQSKETKLSAYLADI